MDAFSARWRTWRDRCTFVWTSSLEANGRFVRGTAPWALLRDILLQDKSFMLEGTSCGSVVSHTLSRHLRIIVRVRRGFHLGSLVSANQPLFTNSDRKLDPKVIQERYDLLKPNLCMKRSNHSMSTDLLRFLGKANFPFADRSLSGEFTGPFATRSPYRPCLLQGRKKHTWGCFLMTLIK